MANSKAQYQQAHDEWSQRIGSAKAQARNWRFVCLLSFLVLVLAIVALLILLGKQKTYVYVAEVKPGNQIVNVHAMDQGYTPTQAQKEYFIGKFIHNIMSLPIDPVVVRGQWLNAYAAASGRAVGQLNTMARTHNPLADIGTLSKVVKITRFNAISNASFEFSWEQRVYDHTGKLKRKNNYSGTFTVGQGPTPKTQTELLNNPFGLQILYFSISNEEG